MIRRSSNWHGAVFQHCKDPNSVAAASSLTSIPSLGSTVHDSSTVVTLIEDRRAHFTIVVVDLRILNHRSRKHASMTSRLLFVIVRFPRSTEGIFQEYNWSLVLLHANQPGCACSRSSAPRSSQLSCNLHSSVNPFCLTCTRGPATSSVSYMYGHAMTFHKLKLHAESDLSKT
jgi:hypothetical protein